MRLSVPVSQWAELSLVSTSLSTSLLVLHRLQHVQSAAQKSECPPKVLETWNRSFQFTKLTAVLPTSTAPTLLQRDNELKTWTRCCCRGWGWLQQSLAWPDFASLCFAYFQSNRKANQARKKKINRKSNTIQLESNSKRMQFKNTLLILLLCIASDDHTLRE